MYIPPKAKNPSAPNREQRKKIKKLCKKLRNYPLFQIRKNAKYKVAEVILLAIDAAMQNQSLEAISNVNDGMSADDALLHLKSKAVIELIEQMLFELLDKHFLKLLKRRFPMFRKWIAIDFTPEPFYGDKNSPYITGYEPKDGTYYCFKFMTVSLLMPQGKYFLFSYPVYRGTDRIWLLNKAFCFLDRLGVAPELCLMDREFYAVDVIAFCREKRCHYLIPAKHDSKFERYVKDLGKLPGLVRDYEITNQEKESEWTNLVVMESEDTEKEQIFGFITNLPESRYKDDVYNLADIYKKRWMIETAHRVHDNFRIKTCCKEGIVRYFFFIIAVLLYNIWVYINLMLTHFACEKDRRKITVFQMKKIVEGSFHERQWKIPAGIAM
jgi:putative transposase